MKGRKVWMGSDPTACDLCHAPIVGEFVDGRMSGITTWAKMCMTCHGTSGAGLGQGLGQKYRLEDSKWVKVAG